MTGYTVGNVIKDARERLGYSQEELCYGICTASTLSRIENGVQIPGRKILEALTERLGIADRIFSVYQSREEACQYEMEKQLVRSLGDGDYPQAERLVAALQEKMDDISGKDVNQKTGEQYLKFARVLIKKHQGEAPQKVLSMLMDTIHMTLPEFDGVHLNGRLLTFQEITILNNIGCACHDLGETWKGLRLLTELKEYLESHRIAQEEMSVKYVMILYNMSTWLGEKGQYEDVLKLCQTGIDFCIKYGKLHAFPWLLCNKASALAELGQFDNAQECFLQSIAVFQATNQQERAGKVQAYANMQFGMGLNILR